MACSNPSHSAFWRMSSSDTCMGCQYASQQATKGEDKEVASSPLSSVENNHADHSSPPSSPESNDSNNSNASPPPVQSEDVDLIRHFSRQEGTWILHTSTSLLSTVNLITSILPSTKHTFTILYRSAYPLDTMVPRTIIQAYTSVFETLANTLSPAFSERDSAALQKRFPAMWSWMSDVATLGEAPSSAKREWRNACAHRAYIEGPFQGHSTNDLRTQQFEPGAFWKANMEWMPPLQRELRDLVEMLEREVMWLEEKDYAAAALVGHEFSCEAQARNEEYAKILVDEENQEIVKLQEEEDAAMGEARRLDVLKCQKEDIALQARAKKMARAQEIWEAQEKASKEAAAAWGDSGDVHEEPTTWDSESWLPSDYPEPKPDQKIDNEQPDPEQAVREQDDPAAPDLTSERADIYCSQDIFSAP